MINNRIKRIIATTLTVGALSAVGPAQSTNLFIEKAHAATTTTDTLNEITGLGLTTSSGSDLNIYEDKSYDSEASSPEVGKTYYAKTSKNRIVVNIEGVDESKIRIFKGSKVYEVGDKISIPSGEKTTLKIRAYEKDYDDEETYSASDYNQYSIVIKNTSDKSSYDSSTSGGVDVARIALSEGDIHFDPTVLEYDFNVPASANTLKIQARPTDKDNTVSIDGINVTDGDNYVKAVSLSTGANKIEVQVARGEESKVYTLNITKDKAPVTPASVPISRGWINTNGVWSYLDSNGIKMKGWIHLNDVWYFLNNDGIMQTGWIYTNDSWYYLYSDGSMATNNWLQNGDNWYYLTDTGAMATDTKINGYKIGSDGVWIK